MIPKRHDAKPQEARQRISAAQLAVIVGVTPRTLLNLATEGVIPNSNREGYDLIEVSTMLFAHYRAESTTKEKIEAEKLIALRRKNEEADGIKNGALYTRDKVEEILTTGIQKLEMVPTQIESEFSVQAGLAKRLCQLLDEARHGWADELERSKDTCGL